MIRETIVQSEIKLFERLKKLYMILFCLTLSIIRYKSRVSGTVQGKK